VFHLITIYWTGGFTVGKDVWMMTAGAAVILVHPIFFLPFILLSFYIKKRLGDFRGLIAFALFWVSFEYLHSLGEYSFPWLTIGNSQAYDLNRIQLIEYISIYGLSLLVLMFNILAFMLLWRLVNSNWRVLSRPIIVTVTIILILYFGSAIYGKFTIEKESTKIEDKIRIGIVQPNFDPWEKWGGGSVDKWDSYLDQFNTYINETKVLSQKKPDIIVWPETAIPFHVLLPRHSTYLAKLFSLVDTLKIPILTGFPAVEYFDSLNAPATAQQIGVSHLYVEAYNSTIFIQPGQILGPLHKKTILVPFAERIPYAEKFRFLIEPLKWNVGISGWGKGNDTIVYSMSLGNGRQTQFSGMICYESVYPNYVKEFVKQGAHFLIVLTNDSWWGNTSGAYQHATFASLRAVETRRWIVQCANGGISMIVDPTGKTHFATKLYTKAQFVGDVGLRSYHTFYVKYGDIVAQLCLIASILMFAGTFIVKHYDAADKSNSRKI
jgi:apolipoprotein N-acyltransferase